MVKATWRVALLSALMCSAPTLTSAQMVIGGNGEPDVVVNWAVLDSLGRQPSLADMLKSDLPPQIHSTVQLPGRADAQPSQGLTYKPYKAAKSAAAAPHKTAKAAPKPAASVKAAMDAPKPAPVAAAAPAPKPAPASVAAAPAAKPAPAPVAAAAAPAPKAAPVSVAAAPASKAAPASAPQAAPAEIAAAKPAPAPVQAAQSKPVVPAKPEIATIASAPVAAPTPITPPVPPAHAPAVVVAPAPASAQMPVAVVPPKAEAPAPMVAAVPPAPVVTPQQVASLPSAETAMSKSDTMSLVFAEGSSKVEERSRTLLQALAKRMQKDEDINLQLLAYASGAADETSKARRLSLSRALEVRKLLMDKGVRSTRIEVRALGNRGDDSGAADRVDVIMVNR